MADLIKTRAQLKTRVLEKIGYPRVGTDGPNTRTAALCAVRALEKLGYPAGTDPADDDTKTQDELITRVLEKLDVVGTQQSGEDEDVEAVRISVEPVIESLNGQRIANFTSVATIPQRAFEQLADCIAYACGDLGTVSKEKLLALKVKAENELRAMFGQTIYAGDVSQTIEAVAISLNLRKITLFTGAIPDSAFEQFTDCVAYARADIALVKREDLLAAKMVAENELQKQFAPAVFDDALEEAADSVTASLNGRNIVYISQKNSIPNEAFEQLADCVAFACSGIGAKAPNGQRTVSVDELAARKQSAEYELRQMFAGPPQYETLRRIYLT